MKKRCRGVRFLNSFLSAIAVVLANASYALANNGPGPVGMVLTFVVLVLIVALTLAGGGSGVLARLQAAKYPSKARRILANIMEFIAGVVLFFMGIIIVPVFGLLGFSIYAIVRGVKMIRWSKEAEKDQPRPAHLEGVSPKRLKAAGYILIVLTLLISGYSAINFEKVAGIDDSRYRKRGYAAALNAEARNAHTTAMAYLLDNPQAGMVTCSDMEKAGYKPSSNVTCFSDMTATSGAIRMTGPERWKLKKPIAIITYSGELTPAEP